jgi:hypothetical protein
MPGLLAGEDVRLLQQLSISSDLHIITNPDGMEQAKKIPSIQDQSAFSFNRSLMNGSPNQCRVSMVLA